MARPPRRPMAKHQQIAANLRANPGQWADVHTYRSRYTAMGIARCIRSNGREANGYQPAGAFEAEIENVEEGTLVRARYVGPVPSPAAAHIKAELAKLDAAARRRQSGAVQHLLDTIRAEGGEWTVGRAKPVYRAHLGSHTYRTTIRRHLALLHTAGYLHRHGDGTPRRFYTYRPEGASL
ncbi:hypothetical protein [Streptomyces sp. NPDC096153]|uniref:hypothetical protein n=1 Tax=Streptomyces sp. NPDC096153 TaxID=3155548 RepID=UPI00331C9930